MKKLLYLYPKSGGLANYADKMSQAYAKISGIKMTAHAWPDQASVSEVFDYVQAESPDVVHFEIGSNQSTFYAVSQLLLGSKPFIKQIVTIHDPAIIVAHPSGWMLPAGRSPQLIFQKIIRLTHEKLWGRRHVRAWVQNRNIKIMVLRPGAIDGATYLPHPTFLPRKKVRSYKPNSVMKIGFLGYWDESKGLSTLLDAWEVGIDTATAQLTIYGDSFVPGDAYATTIKNRVNDMAGVSLGGIPDTTDDLTRLMRELDIVILPYHLNNPAGVSGIAMRAAEVGVPIVASRAPQLTELLGNGAEFYNPADSSSALHSAMKYALQNYPVMMERAKQLQTRIYTDHSMTKLEDILQSVLNSLQDK